MVLSKLIDSYLFDLLLLIIFVIVPVSHFLLRKRKFKKIKKTYEPIKVKIINEYELLGHHPKSFLFFSRMKYLRFIEIEYFIEGNKYSMQLRDWDERYQEIDIEVDAFIDPDKPSDIILAEYMHEKEFSHC